MSYHVCPICNVGVFISARELEARLRACAPVLTPEASRILDAARAMPFALRDEREPVDPWMGLAHLIEAVRAEDAALRAALDALAVRT